MRRFSYWFFFNIKAREKIDRWRRIQAENDLKNAKEDHEKYEEEAGSNEIDKDNGLIINFRRPKQAARIRKPLLNVMCSSSINNSLFHYSQTEIFTSLWPADFMTSSTMFKEKSHSVIPLPWFSSLHELKIEAWPVTEETSKERLKKQIILVKFSDIERILKKILKDPE